MEQLSLNISSTCRGNNVDNKYTTNTTNYIMFYTTLHFFVQILMMHLTGQMLRVFYNESVVCNRHRCLSCSLKHYIEDEWGMSTLLIFIYIHFVSIRKQLNSFNCYLNWWVSCAWPTYFFGFAFYMKWKYQIGGFSSKVGFYRIFISITHLYINFFLYRLLIFSCT